MLSLPNVKYMIIFEGVNDIGNRFGRARTRPAAIFPGLDQPEITAEQMIAGYRQLIARAHAKGIKVIGSPIGPYKGAGYWTEEGEAARQKINDWIVNSGAFDGVTRIDTAFADPADPRQMREGYHMGDHLHGSDAGLQGGGRIHRPDAVQVRSTEGRMNAEQIRWRRIGSGRNHGGHVHAWSVVRWCRTLAHRHQRGSRRAPSGGSHVAAPPIPVSPRPSNSSVYSATRQRLSGRCEPVASFRAPAQRTIP